MLYKNCCRFFLLIGLCLPLSACAISYSAEPIDAWVVDAETKQPIEGVIITANWQLQSGNAGGSFYAGQLMVMETVTDKKGRFYFPAWGPLRPKQGYLINRDPQLLLFKSGYEYLGLSNTPFRENMHKDPVRKSDWNGKTIELKPFKGTAEEYSKALGTLSLSWAYTGNECEWKRIPHMALAAHKQAMSFKKQGIMTSLYTIDNLIPYEGYPDMCGAREYFKEHRP